MESQNTSKTSWPEVVGKTGEEAKTEILNENPNLQVDVLPDGSPVFEDYREDRVRIFTNAEGIVVHAPMIG